MANVNNLEDRIQRKAKVAKRRGNTMAGMTRSLEAFNKRFNRAINTMVETNLRLKDKNNLSKSEIKRLSKTLKGATLDILYFRGVAPVALKKCYEMYEHLITKKQVKA